MIKINLLPPHVVEKRKVRSLAVLLLALLLVELGGFSFYYATLKRTEADRKAKYAEVNARATEVEGLQAEAQAELAAAKPLLSKVGWYENIYQKNSKIADTLEKINEYIYAKMTVRSLTLNGGQVNIQASTRDLDHVASAYLNLLRSPYINPPRGVSFSPAIQVASARPGARPGPMTSTSSRPGMGRMDTGGDVSSGNARRAMPGSALTRQTQPRQGAAHSLPLRTHHPTTIEIGRAHV